MNVAFWGVQIAQMLAAAMVIAAVFLGGVLLVLLTVMLLAEHCPLCSSLEAFFLEPLAGALPAADIRGLAGPSPPLLSGSACSVVWRQVRSVSWGLCARQ